MGTAESIKILEVLGKEYNSAILRATHEPRSAQELSEELDVPIATCYRRIEKLTEAGLLELYDQPTSDEGRCINRYRRTFEEIHIKFNENDARLRIEEPSEVKNKLNDIWRTFSETRR